MADFNSWEAQQRAAMADMQRKVDAVQAAIGRIDVRTSSRNGELGVTVDARGHVRDIHLTAQALRLGENRLAQVLLETIQHAETDAARQAAKAARPLTGDPAIAEAMKQVRRMTTDRSDVGEPSSRRMMTEAEIQAADDAYFDRMNRRGWR